MKDMNEKVLKTLEFNKIIDRLKELAGSAIGKEKCADLKPVSDIEEIQTLQAETAAALNRIYRKGSLSFSGIHDIRASIKRLEIRSTLGMGELMHISSVLTASEHVKQYGEQSEGEAEDALSERFRLIEPLRNMNCPSGALRKKCRRHFHNNAAFGGNSWSGAPIHGGANS